MSRMQVGIYQISEAPLRTADLPLVWTLFSEFHSIVSPQEANTGAYRKNVRLTMKVQNTEILSFGL